MVFVPSAFFCCYRPQNASSSRRLGDNHLPTLSSPLVGSHNAPLREDTPKSDLKRASRLHVSPQRADRMRCMVCSVLSISLIKIIIIIINSRNFMADVTCFF